MVTIQSVLENLIPKNDEYSVFRPSHARSSLEQLDLLNIHNISQEIQSQIPVQLEIIEEASSSGKKVINPSTTEIDKIKHFNHNMFE